MGIPTVFLIGAGAASTIVAVPVVLGVVGFTPAGITAGSIAAKMMSSVAVANGGGVAAGSTVAVLQSIGATGLSAAAKAALGSVGGGIAAAIAR